MGLFKSDTVQLVHDISVVYSPSMGSQIIEVVFNNPNIIRNEFGLGNVAGAVHGLVDEFRTYASINSLPEINLPDIKGEDSESEKLVKAQSFEWATARFELVVYKKAKNQADWAEVGVSALKNSGGFRYRIHRILDLLTDNIGARVGEWGRIGVSIRGVGYGLPAAFDRITITGHWVQEFTWVQEHPTYVVINQYGNSPSPTPTPTPTPPPVPTLTLALASGSTSAVANNDEKINLVVTDIPVGVTVSGTWFKGGVDTGIAESVVTTGSAIQLSTLKLRDKLSGQYKLRLFYNDTGYLSNEVSVTVNPEITLSLPNGVSSAQTGSFTPIAIAGKYFPVGSPVIYQWVKSPSDETSLPTGSFTLAADGTFSTSQNASIFQVKGTGNYKLKIWVGSTSTPPYYSNEISVTQTFAPTVTFNKTSANISNYYPEGTQVVIKGFTAGDILSATWFKNDVEVTGSTSNITYSNNVTNGGYEYTWDINNFKSSPYTGAGVYKLRIVKGTVSIFSATITINDIRSTESPPALG